MPIQWNIELLIPHNAPQDITTVLMKGSEYLMMFLELSLADKKCAICSAGRTCEGICVRQLLLSIGKTILAAGIFFSLTSLLMFLCQAWSDVLVSSHSFSILWFWSIFVYSRTHASKNLPINWAIFCACHSVQCWIPSVDKKLVCF